MGVVSKATVDQDMLATNCVLVNTLNSRSPSCSVSRPFFDDLKPNLHEFIG